MPESNFDVIVKALSAENAATTQVSLVTKIIIFLLAILSLFCPLIQSEYIKL